MLKRAFLLLILSLILTTACKKDTISTEPGQFTSESEYYEKGIALLKKNPEKGRLLLKQVIQLYPTSIFAQKAKISIADSYVKKNDAASLLIAVSEYQEYLGLYPNSPDAVYARYQIGMCYFHQMKKPGRDQTSTLSAIKAFEALIRQFPETRESEMAQTHIKRAKQTVARHIFLIGRTNYLVNAFQGAVNRFKEVMDNYPDYSGMPELIFFTARSYLGLGDIDSARSFFQQVIQRYPESPYSKKAQDDLNALPSQKN